MKKLFKSKTFVGALLSIALCVSLITGATFAIFTSEANVNIAVTSGTVKVTATIDKDSVQSKQLYGDYEKGSDKTYAQSVTVGENSVAIDKMVPGDGVKFNINVTNLSNVTVSYRTSWQAITESDLLGALTITIDGEEYNGYTTYGNWGTFNVGEDSKTVEVAIELKEEVGNEYQSEKVELAFAVEAVQGNAKVDNFVAAIGETKYETLEEAVKAVQAGETIEILRAGTYAPFQINKENVTVKGIIGATKSASTVIKNTATQNIQTYADGITLKNLWIDSTTPQSIAWMNSGAVDAYTSINAGIVAQNITIDGCTINGNGAAGSFAFLYCGQTFTLTNNTFNDFETVYSAMCDNGSLTKAIVTGNTFNNVLFPVSGYWGAQMTGSDYNIVVTGNKFNDGAIIHLWDYYQYQCRNNATAPTNVAVKAQINGNEGNYSVVLTHNDWFVENGNAIEESVKVAYRRLVKFDVDSVDYKVYNKDGSEIETVMYDSTTLGDQGGYLALYAISEGEYLVKNTVTGETYPFEVKATELGKTQVYTPISEGFAKVADKEYVVSNAAGMTAYRNYIEDKKIETKPIVKLSEDIDMTGVVWNTPSWGSMADGNGIARVGIFDGQGHTISNMVIKGKAMFVRLGGETAFKNVTFDNCSNDEGGIDISGKKDVQFRAIIVSQYVSKVSFDNVTIKNSSVAGYWGCGLFAGNVGHDDPNGSATFNNCHIENCTVGGWNCYCGGFVGYVATTTEYTGENSITGLTLQYARMTSDAEKLIGFVEVNDNGAIGIDSHENVTVTNCTKVKVYPED